MQYQFVIASRGRSGTIACSTGDHELTIDWEMSGSPEHDMLLAPLRIHQWDSGAEIPRDEQRRILLALRAWLREQNTRSDLDISDDDSDPGNRCARRGCDDPALRGSAYCGLHYDETLLA